MKAKPGVRADNIYLYEILSARIPGLALMLLTHYYYYYLFKAYYIFIFVYLTSVLLL